MSLQVGFFPNANISKGSARLTFASAAAPEQNTVSNQKEIDPELKKLLEFFCGSSAEKTMIG
ncbi:MAG: hypothetical protein JSS53_04820 [Proteobacteria bacterium]|nr:hypothetical protein [Pseudomonadota bacterium]